MFQGVGHAMEVTIYAVVECNGSPDSGLHGRPEGKGAAFAMSIAPRMFYLFPISSPVIVA